MVKKTETPMARERAAASHAVKAKPGGKAVQPARNLRAYASPGSSPSRGPRIDVSHPTEGLEGCPP